MALQARDIAAADNMASLERHLSHDVDPEFHGFAVEGASMGLVMLDHRMPTSQPRLERFLGGPWGRFSFLMHAGAGLGLADLGEPVLPYVNDRADIQSAFAIDGYAFHLALVAPLEHLAGGPTAEEFAGPASTPFDSGLGRSAWFALAAEPSAIAPVIDAFPVERRDDLWSGIGYAATYARGLDERGLRVLADAAAGHSAALAGGAALAVHTRLLCGNLCDSNEAASLALAGRDAAEASEICVHAGKNLPAGDTLGAFVEWHHRIRDALACR